jgi:hypothetical protein
MVRNIKHIKSTILGTAFIICALWLLIQGIDVDFHIASGLLIAGTLLLFSPDTFINRLEKLVFGSTIWEKKKENNSDKNPTV